MAGLIKTITAIVVAVFLQAGMNGATDVSPAQEADAFMKGMTTLQKETVDLYMGNDIANFLVDVEGDEKDVKCMQEALFRNFTYEIVADEERNGLAVVKISIKGNDFSKVLKKYEKESYKYVTENLYDEDITDKKKLNNKCMSIYVDQIEKTAKNGKLKEDTIYLPMEDDGHNQWNVLLNDEVMTAIIGHLSLPDGVVDSGEDGEEKEKQ